MVLGVDDLEREYVTRGSEKRLEIVDALEGRLVGPVELPGVPLTLVDRHGEGASVYVREEGESGCSLSAVSLSNLQRLARKPKGHCVIWLRASPDREWVAASTDRSLRVWSSGLSAELAQMEVTGASYLAATLPNVSPDVEPCVGDCDASGTVTVDEIVRAVRVALAEDTAMRCLAADATGDERIAIEELIPSVRYLLEGCLG